MFYSTKKLIDVNHVPDLTVCMYFLKKGPIMHSLFLLKKNTSFLYQMKEALKWFLNLKRNIGFFHFT